jgi:hypothetical protein
MEVKNIITENRIGKFKVSKDFFEEATEDIFLLFSKTLISRCGLINPHTFECCGYSEMFEPAEKRHLIPEYTIEVERKETGELTFKAKKLGGGS